MTEDPVLERTEIEDACRYCGAPIEVDYRQEQRCSAKLEAWRQPRVAGPGAVLRRGVNDEEKMLDTDPFAAELTFTLDGDAITRTVDEDLDVVDVVEHDVHA